MKFDSIVRTYIIYVLAITIGVFKSYISFGTGLGDIIMIGAHYPIGIIIILLNKYLDNKIWSILLIVVTITISLLCLTLLRGSENSWNGSLFV